MGGVSRCCGRWGSQARLNDRALFSAAAPVSIGLGQTIARVTGLLRPGMRGLMSQDQAGEGGAGRGWPAWGYSPRQTSDRRTHLNLQSRSAS